MTEWEVAEAERVRLHDAIVTLAVDANLGIPQSVDEALARLRKLVTKRRGGGA